MLTFDDVYNAPVDKLKTAADDWSEMVTKLEKLADDARTGMQAKSNKADWRGVNAEVTKPFIQKTAKEFDDAAKEAKGIQLILVDGHTAFKQAKDDLKKLVDEEAPAQGLKIDSHGKVSAGYPLEKDVAARHDPDYPQALQKQKNDIAAMQRRVDRIVEDCSDADDSLARALKANVTDDHNFSGPKYNSLDDEQVDRAAGLVKKVTGEGGTARNVEALKELEELMDDNRTDPEFATAFYRKLGAEGSLEAYTKMSLDSTGLGPAGQDRANMVHNIQNDMGSMLGIATSKDTKGHLDAGWTNDLMKAGRKQIDVSGFAGLNAKVYGYQALGSLLRDGKYDTEFLTSVGRDMVAMDRKNPQVWEEGLPYNQTMAFNQDKDGGKGFYPLTGLMEAMSNNPEASTAFFNEPVREDSNGDGIVTKDDKVVGGQHGKAQGMVDYMLDKKPMADWFDTRTGEGAQAQPAQTAMGNALEAAVTQRVPGDDDAKPVKHTADMANVMERVVAKIGDDPTLVAAKPGDPPGPLSGLSGHFGNMAAEYMPDIQAAAENGADQIKPFGVMADFDKAEMAGFLGAVAQDPGAYGAITNAQQAYTTALVHDVFQHPSQHGDMGEAVRNAVHPGGEIAGIMTEARAQAVHDTHAHDDKEFNEGVAENAKWTNRILSAVGAKYVEMIPVGGDVVEWLQEDITESVVKGAEQDTTDEARRESAAGYTRAEENAKVSAENAVVSGARGTGLTPEQIREFKGSASTETASAHSIGRDLVASSSSKGN
ncbi:hypothetical protein [Streptomyces sp. NPDC051219]|uniref:hypothetical protein n=1 Tax=Streptomyces sp. NPDC051219 TaxID=3155283 RepID=UPI003417A20D